MEKVTLMSARHHVYDAAMLLKAELQEAELDICSIADISMALGAYTEKLIFSANEADQMLGTSLRNAFTNPTGSLPESAEALDQAFLDYQKTVEQADLLFQEAFKNLAPSEVARMKSTLVKIPNASWM
ncbi:hypothetical protein [Neptuniibacter sp. QD37_11]|uniref:hypothetical protein n=1 Tax=Neptuniibacter sp. QD37_11 TaxID=3398209 RepID=UPI0039F630DA